MTIGITALIKPSKILIGLTLLMSFLTLFSIIWTLLHVSSPQYFSSICILILFLGLLLIRVQWKYWKNLKIIQLEISNKGDMIVRFVNENENEINDQNGAEIVQLQPQSVLWPFFMILLLRTHQGELLKFPIFLDSVEKNTFRKLSVALRWISIRSHE